MVWNSSNLFWSLKIWSLEFVSNCEIQISDFLRNARKVNISWVFF